jgi:hypothetical protein
VWVFTFSINIILHHTIISYRIASHHTSFCISKKAIEKKEICSFENTCRILKECVVAQHKPSTDILCYTKLTFVNSGIRKIFFFPRATSSSPGQPGHWTLSGAPPDSPVHHRLVLVWLNSAKTSPIHFHFSWQCP